MSIVPQRLKELRKEFKLTQADVAKYLNISESAYGYYEQGRNEISIGNVQLLAEKYGVSVAYILGETNVKGKLFTERKDERDIAKRMEQLRNDLQHAEGLAFNGEPMSEEAKEALLEAMEFGVRMAKLNNKKFIPKKYRENNEE